jgi:vancomycin resistance protein YoaR
MYEKYSGLPDTTKSASQGVRGRRQSGPARDAAHEGNYDDMEYYYTPNRGGGSSGGRRGSRQAKYRKRRLILLLMTVLFLALIVTAVVVIARSCGSTEIISTADNRFRNEVYINGMNVSGQTLDDVIGQLETNESYALNNIAVVLRGEGFSATVTGPDMGASSNLDEIVQQALAGGANQVYYTTISIDEEALASRIEAINENMTTPPTDATFEIESTDSGKPTFRYIEGVPGYGLDVASTTELVRQAVESGQYQTTIEPTLTVVEPSNTIEDIQANTSLICSFSTTYSFKGTADDTEEAREMLIPNRAFNVEKAAELINGQVVKPGATWSFNDTVGDRNEKNGWKLANGIFGGDTLTHQYGGGVCQVSSTLYNALLEGYPYFDFSRRKHSIPSTYVDKGLDATVDTGHIDFKFTNKSDYSVYIFAYVSKNSMYTSRKRDITVLIYGEALPEGVEYKTRTVLVEEIAPAEDIIVESKSLFIGEEEIITQAREGYVVDVFIDRYLDGVLQESIWDHTDTYDGNPQKIRVGTQATPTPVIEPTPTPIADDLP